MTKDRAQDPGERTRPRVLVATPRRHELFLRTLAWL